MSTKIIKGLRYKTKVRATWVARTIKASESRLASRAEGWMVCGAPERADQSSSGPAFFPQKLIWHRLKAVLRLSKNPEQAFLTNCKTTGPGKRVPNVLDRQERQPGSILPEPDTLPVLPACFPKRKTAENTEACVPASPFAQSIYLMWKKDRSHTIQGYYGPPGRKYPCFFGMRCGIFVQTKHKLVHEQDRCVSCGRREGGQNGGQDTKIQPAPECSQSG